MAVSYIPADADSRAVLDDLIAEHRPDLIAAGATIAFLFAYSDGEGPPLKVRGQKVAGQCKINSLQDRVEGKADATIKVDGSAWKDWPKQRRRALLHHELCHIAAWSFMDDGRDDADRPALKARHGDWDFDGFHEILREYGEDSFEMSNLKAVAEEHGQLRMFAGPPIFPADTTLSVNGVPVEPGRKEEAIGAILDGSTPPGWPAKPEGDPTERLEAAIDDALGDLAEPRPRRRPRKAPGVPSEAVAAAGA